MLKINFHIKTVMDIVVKLANKGSDKHNESPSFDRE